MEQHAVMSPRSHRVAAGFTLIELLTVLAVVAILAAASVPVVSALMQSNNLAQAGTIVADQIDQARQMAAVRNRTVEVRLINRPGVSAKGCQAVQLWMYDSSGSASAAGKMMPLPAGISISDDPGLSGLFSTQTNAMAFKGTISSGPATGNSYVAFRLRPTGEIEPVPVSTARKFLYLTLLPTRLVTAGTTTLPSNYVMEQINPDTGSVQIYRP